MEGCPILADLHSLPFRFIYETKQLLVPLKKCLTLLFPVHSCEKFFNPIVPCLLLWEVFNPAAPCYSKGFSCEKAFDGILAIGKQGSAWASLVRTHS